MTRHIWGAFALSASALLLAGCPAPQTDTTTTTVATNSGSSSAPANTTNTSGDNAATPPVNSSSANAANIKTVGANDALKLAVVTNNASDYWTICRRGVEKADAELPNTSVEFRLPADGTAQEQNTILQQLVVKGAQGIAMSPVDAKNQTDIINTTASKALLLTQDSDAPQSKRVFYIGTDNVAAGRQAGEEIKKVMPNGGKIVLFVGTLDAQNASDRKAGIEDALKGSKIQVLDTLTDETKRDKAISNASVTLLKSPDVGCLVGLWSYNGPAILDAVRKAGKVGKVKIVCFDEEDPTLDGVRDGAISATIVQNPYEFGFQSVKLMDKVLRGDKSAIPQNGLNIVPTRVINTGNVAAFRVELKKLRGK